MSLNLYTITGERQSGKTTLATDLLLKHCKENEVGSAAWIAPTISELQPALDLFKNNVQDVRFITRKTIELMKNTIITFGAAHALSFYGRERFDAIVIDNATRIESDFLAKIITQNVRKDTTIWIVQ